MNVYTKKVCFCLKRKLRKIFETALDVLGQASNVGVSVCFVDEKEIQRLNKEFRNVDKVTDVLSFPSTNIIAGEKVEKFKDPLFDEVYVGDIAICVKKAKQQAKEFGHSYKREVCFLALHGFLHLLGYDHIEKKDEKVMMGIAEKVLEKENIRRKK